MAYDPFDNFERFLKRMMRELERELGRMEDFEREFGRMPDFEHIMREFKSAAGRPVVSGFKIEIKDTGEGKPEVRIMELGKPSARPARVAPVMKRAQVREAQPAREFGPVKQMLETNAGKIERPTEVVITMQAPGIRLEDVEFRRLNHVIEVVARKPDGNAYFGTFELPPDARPGQKKMELKQDLLVISIPRGR